MQKPCISRIEARNVVPCARCVIVQLVLLRTVYAYVRWHAWVHASNRSLARSITSPKQTAAPICRGQSKAKKNIRLSGKFQRPSLRAPSLYYASPIPLHETFRRLDERFIRTREGMTASDHIMSLMLILLLPAPLLLGLGDTEPG